MSMITSSRAASARSPRIRTLGCVLRPSRARRQYGVRVGLRVQLAYGLAAPRTNRPRCQCRLSPYPSFIRRGSASHRWTTGMKLKAEASKAATSELRRNHVASREYLDFLTGGHSSESSSFVHGVGQ